jgi:large subunit ribosomal protein L9
MQIILLEKVVNLGDLGQVVKVKNGFARNFLIPQGKAKRATAENIKMLEERRSDLEKLANQKMEHAQAEAAQLEGMRVEIRQKSGVDGRLFGSVTNADIVEALKARGHTVEKAMVRLPEGPLKQVGEYPITVALHSDASAHITVAVLGEQVAQ